MAWKSQTFDSRLVWRWGKKTSKPSIVIFLFKFCLSGSGRGCPKIARFEEENMMNHGISRGPKKIFRLSPSMAAKSMPWHLLNLPQQLSSHPQECSDCTPRVAVGSDSGPTCRPWPLLGPDFKHEQNCCTLENYLQLWGSQFSDHVYVFFPDSSTLKRGQSHVCCNRQTSGARTAVTDGEQPSVKRKKTAHTQIAMGCMAKPDDPKNGLMNIPQNSASPRHSGPRCQRHIPHSRHNATTHLPSWTMWHYVTMGPISELTGAPQPIWGEETKHDFRLTPALCCTDMMSYGFKGRLIIFITKSINNAQKFIW